ncbi:TIGR03643 family protein [Algirhabdus cladophorae]|uniref:TIGR03643 family protein n=1 Tax=Algirhabdus cladophorae TaxID=3377108 RepID=UPI003B8476AC
MSKTDLSEADTSAIIEMALSDHMPFETIKLEYGLREAEVVALMRSNLKSGSYRAWRKRVHDFGTRRASYK